MTTGALSIGRLNLACCSRESIALMTMAILSGLVSGLGRTRSFRNAVQSLFLWYFVLVILIYIYTEGAIVLTGAYLKLYSERRTAISTGTIYI